MWKLRKLSEVDTFLINNGMISFMHFSLHKQTIPEILSLFLSALGSAYSQ